MPRIRTVKPEFWTDGKMNRLSDSCCLFFIGLWNFCDDEGKFKADPLELSSFMPRFKSQHISKWLRMLFEAGSIELSPDFKWGSVKHWNHQKINRPHKPKFPKSELQWIQYDASNDSLNVHGAFTANSLNVHRKDRIGKDRIGKDSIVATSLNTSDEISENSLNGRNQSKTKSNTYNSRSKKMSDTVTNNGVFEHTEGLRQAPLDATHGNDWTEIEGQQVLSMVQDTPANERKRPAKRNKEPAPSTELWEAYREAYAAKYNHEPVRGQRANVVFKQMLKEFGAQESVAIIRYYFQHNGSFYVQNMHKINLLQADMHKLRTELLSGKRFSSNQAKILERDQANGDAIKRHLEKRMAQFRKAEEAEQPTDDTERGAQA